MKKYDKNLYKEILKKNINNNKNIYVNKIDDNLCFLEIEKIFNNMDQNIHVINKSKMMENKKYFAFIDIDYKKQYCIIEKNNNNFIIFLKDKKYKFNKKDFDQIKIIKIWNFYKKNNNFFGVNFQKIKTNYVLVSLSLNFLYFIFLIIGNLYLKLIIQNIIPNNALFDFIFLSLLFAIIFIVNILIESFLKIYKNKQLNIVLNKYLSNFFDEINNKNYEFIKQNSQKEILLSLKSILPVIERKIFCIPDLILNLIIVIITIILLGLISYLFILVSIITITFNLFIFLLKKERIKKIKNKENEIINNLDNKIYEYIIELKNSWFLEDFIKRKNNILNMIYECNFFFKKNLEKDEIIKIIEKIGAKIIFIIFSIISVLLVINNNSNYFTIGLMIYCLSLFNIINSNSNLIFEFYSNLYYQKIHENILRKINKKNIVNEGNVKFKNKINLIEFVSFEKKYNDKIVFKKFNKKIKNDSVIIGKNGIGKTTLLKAIHPNNCSSDKIFLNKINKNYYEYNEIKNKIIYINSNTKIIDFDINKILYFNKNLTKKIIVFLKENKIFQMIENKNKSTSEHQILNFLMMLHQKDKIILLDESLSNVETNLKIKLINVFKKEIIKNNFLIWVTHDKKILKYFKNKIELKNE